MSLLSSLITRVTRSAQPAAATSNAGGLAFITDEGVIERSSGSAWETFGFARKDLTGMADATFVDLFTVTVPNVANAARITIELLGSLGAGGTVGAYEGSQAARLELVVTRTVGAATVATVATLTNTAAANVASGATATLAAQASAMTGATSATQTFTIQVKVTRGSGTSTNHKVSAHARLLGSAAGITIT